MTDNKEVSFVVRVQDAASAALKQIEEASAKTTEKLFSFKDILHEITLAAGAISFVEILKSMVDLGVAADTTFRQIAANLPTFTQGIGELKENIEALANVSGRGLEAMEQSAAGIARLGVSSAEELIQVLTAATTLADATGSSVDESAQLLIQLRREFHLTGDEALDTAAKIASISQGKIGIAELQAVFVASAPTFVKFGIDVDTGVRAIGALIDAGLTTSRAIRGELGKLDADAIRELASQSTVATDALDQLNKRAGEVRAGIAQTNTVLKNEFISSLEDLGGTILNKVNGPLKGMIGLMQILKDGNFGAITAALNGNWLAMAQAVSPKGPNVVSATFTDIRTAGPTPNINLPLTEAEKKAADEAAISEGRLEIRLLAAAEAANTAREKTENLARAQGETLKASIEQALGAVTGHLAEAASQAIDDRIKKLEMEVAFNASLDMATKMRLTSELDLTKQIEQAQNLAKPALSRASLAIGAVGLPGVSANDSLTALMAAEQALRAVDDAITKAGGDDLDVKTKLLEIDKKRAEILKAMVAPTKDVADSIRRQMQDTVDHARAIQQAVDGALQLGAAFHLVDQNTTNILRSVGQMAADIPVLVSQLQNLGKVDASGNALATAGSVAGAALPIAGAAATLITAVGSLFGSSSEQRAQADAAAKTVQANTDALRALTARIDSSGLFGALSGSTASTALAQLKRFQGAGLTNDSAADLSLIKGILTPSEFSAIEAAAKALNITFDGTKGSVNALIQALTAGTAALGRFGNDFNSMMAEIDAEQKIMGTSTGAKGDLAQLIAHIGPLSGGIAGIFKDITDGSRNLTADEIAALRKRVQDLFTLMEGAGLTAEQMGGLDGQQFLQVLEKIIADLDAMGHAATDAGTAVSGAADAMASAAAAIAAAAQRMADGVQDIGDTFDVHNTSPLDQVALQAKKFHIDNIPGSLDTQEGRDAAIKWLSAAFDSAMTTEEAHQYRVLIDMIRGLGGGGASAAAAGGRGIGPTGGSLSSITSGYSGLTTLQGDRLADIQVRSLDVLVDIRSLLAIRAPSMAYPSLSLGSAMRAAVSGTSAGSGGSNTIGPITINVTGTSGDPTATGTAIADAFVRELNVKMGRQALVQKTYNGDITVRPA